MSFMIMISARFFQLINDSSTRFIIMMIGCLTIEWDMLFIFRTARMFSTSADLAYTQTLKFPLTSCLIRQLRFCKCFHKIKNNILSINFYI